MKMNRFIKCRIIKQAAVAAVCFFFVISSLFCCCLMNKAHAESSVKIEKKVPSCHASAAKTQSQKSKPCECLKMTREPLDMVVQPFDTSLFLNSLVKAQTYAVESHWPVYISLLRIDTGPPQASRYSIPIYLQTSSLRV